MTPSLIQKKTYRSDWQTLMPVFPFFTSVIWPSHASSFPRVHLRFRLWPLCSPLSVVICSFCSLSIRSRFRTKSWSIIFSSSPFGSHDRSFDPSVIDEEFALAMGTFSFGIVVFPKFAFFGVSSSYFDISTFVLDGSLTSTGPSKSSNVSFPSLISSWTLDLSEVQFSVGWFGFLPW